MMINFYFLLLVLLLVSIAQYKRMKTLKLKV